MLLNIGQDKIISDREIIGIFDLDNTTVSKATRDYINFSVKKRRMCYCFTGRFTEIFYCMRKKR